MKHLLDILYKRKLWTVIYILLGIILALSSAFSASYFQKVLDDFGGKKLLLETILIYGLVLLLICILNYLDEYPSCKLEQGIYLDFKLRAMRKMSTIDYEHYQTLGTGSLVQRIENGASAGKSILFEFYFRLFRELLPSMIFSLIFIASIDKQIMIYIAVGYLFVFAVTNLLLKYLYRIKEKILSNEEIFNKYLIRSFMELVIFRVNKRFHQEINKASGAAIEITSAKTKMRMIHEAFFAIFALFITMIKIIIIFVSWRENSLSVGSLVALITLVDKAYTPIAIFNVLFVQYKLDRSTFKRYSALLDMPEDIHLSSGKILEKVNGDIYFKNVDFSYKDKNIFTNLSLHIKAGSSAAFVGESGAGKSTIVKQMIGLIKPERGAVFIDENDLAQLNLNHFYDYISYTSQESPIFNGSLRENIVFDKDVSDDEILKVLELVELTALYKALPKGLYTEVGERGITLSGGERQRLALARVYFSKGKIIILDEATSAMDNITEELVMKNLMGFLRNKTVIIIAHRLNTVKDVEKIYALKEGKIVGEGSFKELIDKNEYFRELWEAAAV